MLLFHNLKTKIRNCLKCLKMVKSSNFTLCNIWTEFIWFTRFILGNLDFVKLLIKNGADVNAKSNDNKTPLMYAAQNGIQLIYFW